VVSGQWSVVSGQLAVIKASRAAIHRGREWKKNKEGKEK